MVAITPCVCRKLPTQFKYRILASPPPAAEDEEQQEEPDRGGDQVVRPALHVDDHRDEGDDRADDGTDECKANVGDVAREVGDARVGADDR